MTTDRSMTRRTFVGQTAGAAAVPLLAAASSALGQEAASQAAASAPVERKLRIGVVGLGGRGSWIAGLFKEHPGYEIAAAVDYFEETANAVGDKLGVPAGKRFSGLSGYKRALDSGVEALVLEGIPYIPNKNSYNEARWMPSLVPIEVHVLRLGDVAMATNPFELFLDYGIQIKGRSKAVLTFISQLTCDHHGYLPTRRAVAGGDYSAVNHTVGPTGGRVLVDESVKAINSLWP